MVNVPIKNGENQMFAMEVLFSDLCALAETTGESTAETLCQFLQQCGQMQGEPSDTGK